MTLHAVTLQHVDQEVDETISLSTAWKQKYSAARFAKAANFAKYPAGKSDGDESDSDPSNKSRPQQ